MKPKLRAAVPVLFYSVLFAGLSIASGPAAAQGNMPCELAEGGLGECRFEGTTSCFPAVDSTGLGSCYSQRDKHGDWTCVCSTKVLPRPNSSSTGGPHIGIGIDVGIGGDRGRDHWGKDDRKKSLKHDKNKTTDDHKDDTNKDDHPDDDHTGDHDNDHNGNASPH